jgi:hypothetical protein
MYYNPSESKLHFITQQGMTTWKLLNDQFKFDIVRQYGNFTQNSMKISTTESHRDLVLIYSPSIVRIFGYTYDPFNPKSIFSYFDHSHTK